ncbi:nicotinate phosphoribosyltransferase [Rhizophagus clarus]|uniref:Nicotinamide phosphoribosyltransferase n=1 Tax=Rhizophagus clarus TaxID=94130 RepID=A0A8H3QZ02_9GLOM|nr:nicotinate phosphoribosyltransferase [Rhizophagus clarus]
MKKVRVAFQKYQPFAGSKKSVAYGEFRKGYNSDKEDTRVLFYGIRYIIEHYIAIKWTKKDVELAEKFFSTHNAGFTPFPFPKHLFLKFIEENDGYFPVKIEALPEGTSCHAHTPVFQITAKDEYSSLVTYLETIITMVWYPTTVATQSRRARDRIEKAYQETVDDDGYWTLESRLHDFGFRGTTCIEQAVIGGSAHLLNFSGTDTMSAAYYVQFVLNNGNPIGTSIPATEHSVMTAHKTERDAILREIDQYGSGLFSCVMDTYDYSNALDNILPSISKHKVDKGGFMVLRPDSGDPVEAVLMALKAADKVFGSDVNKKGYKLLRGSGVIQGDAITIESLEAILNAVKEAGYAAQNVAFGMGGGLLQKLNRDTMSFATKLSHVTHSDGVARDIMKTPKTDTGKISLPGEFAVKKNGEGVPIVYPKENCLENDPDNLLKVVYDYGKTCEWEDFDTIRKRVAKEWPALPRSYDNISPELKVKIEKVIQEIKENQKN